MAVSFDISNPSTWLLGMETQKPGVNDWIRSYEKISALVPVVVEGHSRALPANDPPSALRPLQIGSQDVDYTLPAAAILDKITDFSLLRYEICSSAKEIYPSPRVYQRQNIHALCIRVPMGCMREQIKGCLEIAEYLRNEFNTLWISFNQAIQPQTSPRTREHYVYIWRLLSLLEIVTQCSQLVDAYYKHILSGRPEEYVALVSSEGIVAKGDKVAVHVTRIAA